MLDCLRQPLNLKNYIIKTPYHLIKFVIGFRTRNHPLQIEIGSWSGIKAVDRKCPLCKCSSSIANEFHYLLNVSHLKMKEK